MNNKIVTGDCITSFVKNHYGKTDISGIGDGTATGAISALNTNMTEYIKNTGYRYYYNTSVNIKPNEYVQTVMDISGVTKPGYVVIPIYAGCSGSGSTMILFNGIAIDGDICKVTLRNIGTSPANVNVIVFMLRTKALD